MPQKRIKIGVTGGIGSGKSHVCRLLEEMGYPVFYCDDEAKRIIRGDAEVKAALRQIVGEEVYAPDGTLAKPVLAAHLCKGREAAAQVDAVVHPRVAQAFAAFAERHAGAVFMECALLFEARFDRFVDCSLLVSAPLDVRLQRVMRRDNISEACALKWIGLQMPEEEKARRADYVLPNAGGEDTRQLLEEFLEKITTVKK